MIPSIIIILSVIKFSYLDEYFQDCILTTCNTCRIIMLVEAVCAGSFMSIYIREFICTFGLLGVLLGAQNFRLYWNVPISCLFLLFPLIFFCPIYDGASRLCAPVQLVKFPT